MSIRRNLVDPVERNYESNQNDDMIVKDGSNKLAVELKESRDIRHYSEKQQVSRSQPHVHQRPTIDWENFLSVRSLNVLLVENDDSTRHAVSALLRNCSYEVTAVSNGLEAWEALKDVTNRVDLVLTELETPYLSGIDLLSKLLSIKTRKNIPVIMMSFNDSVNIVFKCLSNGAVDFLVKPIRKNELKNLWQHVWRKRHNSNGSGSKSGIQTPKSTDGSNNNTNKSNGLTFINGSDNDSVTQVHHSASSKRAQPTSQWDDMENQLEVDEHVAMGKDLTLWAPTTLEQQLKDMKKDKKKQGKEMVEEENTVTASSDIKLKDSNSNSNTTKSCLKIARNEGSNSGTNVQKRNMLRYSDHSVFFRYNIISTNKQALSLNLEKGKIESMQHLQPVINQTPNQTDKQESSLNEKQIPIVTLDSINLSLGDIIDEKAPHLRTFDNLEKGIFGKGILGNAANYGPNGNSIVGGRNVGCDDNALVAIGQHRLAMREAALNKFRQKRKERCFEKKVRYESRKKLAEERPRSFRGKFVRQS